jgi:hypothetical protein
MKYAAEMGSVATEFHKNRFRHSKVGMEGIL